MKKNDKVKLKLDLPEAYLFKGNTGRVLAIDKVENIVCVNWKRASDYLTWWVDLNIIEIESSSAHNHPHTKIFK